MLAIIVMAWVNGALDGKQAPKLLLTTLDGFVGGRDGLGFLGRCDQQQVHDAVERLSGGFVEIGAGLAYAALARDGWAEDIYDWQPALKRGIELGVLLPGRLSESVAAHLADENPSAAQIDELLMHRVDWVDEATWCGRLARELDVGGIRLERRLATVRLGAVVTGCTAPLRDTALLTIARRALDFKHESAIAIRAGDDTFIYEPGAPARAKVAGTVYKSAIPVDAALLRAIEGQGGSWSDLLGVGQPSLAA